MIGRTIDRYRVVEKLGQGGMGVVYKARDTLLGRFVALKLLSPESLADPERKRRFLEEAKAASALNHPGIVAVHDLRSVEGQDFIVMEFVPGETIEQRMAQRALPLSKGLRYAEQMADALARAHAAGIVHRDLKPSNVMVTDDGTVKILDFGLAKLAEAPFPDDASPTVSAERGRQEPTEDGAILGTLAYMSPEQASGRPVDARTDVFSFGVLLYEMLTGHHPFRRGSKLETLAAIREQEPAPPSQVAPALPPEAERAIGRCLHKDPARRWQSMSDLRAVLQDLREDSESGRTSGVGEAARPSRARLWVVAAFATLAAAVVVVGLLRRGPPAVGPLDLSRLTYDSGLTTDPTLAADGKLLAYASDRAGEGSLDIWVQHVNQPQPARLTRHPADDWQPSFAPDGSRIAFRSERESGGIYVVDTLGGEERKLADGGHLPRFSPDGSQIVFLLDAAWAPRNLFKMALVPGQGGPARPFQPDFGVFGLPGSYGPIWSPDGRHLLFSGADTRKGGKVDWWVAPVDGGPPVATGMASLPRVDVVQLPCAWVGRHVIFAAGTTMEGINLYRVRISPGDWKMTGPPEPLTSGPGMTLAVSVAGDGRMALARMQWIIQLWTLDPERRGGSSRVEPRPITHDAAPKFGFSLARESARLAYSAYAGPRGHRRNEVRVQDLATGEETVPIRLSSPRVSLDPHLGPDGALMTWEDEVDGKTVSFVARSGESTGREVCRECNVLAFFSDARHVLVRAGPRRLTRRDLESGSETPLVEPEAGSIFDADISWDDRWLAVAMGRPDGTVATHVAPAGETATPPAQWIPILESRRFAMSPRWSPDGSRLYYISELDGFRCLWAQGLDPATKKPRGEPFAVVHLHRNPLRMFGPRFAFSIAVGRDRLVFNASEATGNILMAKLPPE